MNRKFWDENGFWVLVYALIGLICLTFYLYSGPVTHDKSVTNAIAKLDADNYGNFFMDVKTLDGYFVRTSPTQATSMIHAGIAKPTQIIAIYDVATYHARNGNIVTQIRTPENWDIVH